MAPRARPTTPREPGSGYAGMIAAALVVAAIGAGLLYLEQLHRRGVERPVTNFLSPPEPPRQ
jgi:hypothetical protein